MKVVSYGQRSRRWGVLMFIMLITAYIIFATNWVAGSNLSKQITDYFFNIEKKFHLLMDSKISLFTSFH